MELVVLLGPPGSGKSAVGGALEGRGFRWRDWEGELVRRWGSREAFLADKAGALPELHRSIREWLAASEIRAALETTGLSDAPLLDQLRCEHPTTTVRLDVTEEVAMRRVRARPEGHHLSDEPEDCRRVWQAFNERVLPHHPVDLVVDTEVTSVEAAASRIVALLGGPPS